MHWIHDRINRATQVVRGWLGLRRHYRVKAKTGRMFGRMP